jgi:hypothetical protein
MKLLLQSVMIFFGTLMAAGLVALGDPGGSKLPAVQHAAPVQAAAQLIAALRQGR